MSPFAQSATNVLVNGAWSDGSCWRNVILPLRREGLEVGAPIPLTSLTEDIAALQRVLEKTSGPAVLAGHAYAGAVIAGPNDDWVKSLVYLAALAPAEGEMVADIFFRAKPHPDAPNLKPDANGLIWMPARGSAQAVAHKASPDQAAILEAVQRPIEVKCIQERPRGRRSRVRGSMRNESIALLPERARELAVLGRSGWRARVQ